MSLKATIQQDMKTAMRAGDKFRLGTLRLMWAEIKQREIDDRCEADDDLVLHVLNRMVKQRRDSIAQYRQGGREDLAESEENELAVLQHYLPQPLSAQELDALIERTIDAVGANSAGDMGKVMGHLKQQGDARVDMAEASRRVKQRLN
ncbi:MAG TPA: GatB/YqeY domain-containing protein [Gammaproteobacteria bacterium]|nr:GatB/YqeY domain-containing protein [Gammaproteobacteria bacterium]